MPTFASADRTQIAAIKEVTFGVTPVAGNGFNLRMQGEGFAFDLTKQSDKEISADAQPTSSTTVDADSAGDLKIHMQYAEYDPFFAGVLRSAWAAFGTNGIGATFIGTMTVGTLGTVASTITASVATSGSSLFTTIQPGQWFRLNAPGNGSDGKWVRNSLSVAATSTVITLDVWTPLLVVGTSVAACTVATSRLSNGTTLSSFSIEKQLADVSQYFMYTGQTPSKFSTQLSTAAQTEGTFTFMGKSSVRAAVTGLPGSTVASQTYEIHNGVVGAGTLWEGGAPLISTSIKTISIDIDSALRKQGALGALGAVGVGIGTISVKGNLEVYFADGTLYDKFVGDIYTSLIFSTKDVNGNGYMITLPRAMLTNAKILAGSKNTDVMASFQYEAFADRANANAALRKTVIIDRLGAAVTP